MKNAKIIGCAIAGFFVGGIGGMYVATEVIWPGSNMAGIVGLATAPIGLLVGAIVGKVWAGRERT